MLRVTETKNYFPIEGNFICDISNANITALRMFVWKIRVLAVFNLWSSNGLTDLSKIVYLKFSFLFGIRNLHFHRVCNTQEEREYNGLIVWRHMWPEWFFAFLWPSAKISVLERLLIHKLRREPPLPLRPPTEQYKNRC
jgi:hypothetical protein